MIQISLPILLLLIAVFAILIYQLWKQNKFSKEKIDHLSQELQKSSRNLNDQIERAENSEKYKEFFLANMSHEIRTPMHAISGMTNILRRNEHLPAQTKYLDAIHSSAENLLVILNDVLDSSKIEAGKLKIDQIAMNPSKIIKDVVEILTIRAQEKDLFLTYDIDTDIPEFVVGDPIRLNQILTNLASNAIKFTEQGSVRISCKMIPNENLPKLAYSVEDTGIGIPEDKMKTIFEVFEQVDGTLSKKFGGTGLGLSICKQLVEMQDGSIKAKSKLGGGSVFTFELPLIQLKEEMKSDQKISEDDLMEMGKTLNSLRILLVEDNDFNIMLASDDLSHFIPNIQIETASNGLRAVEMFVQNTYDLILMDIQMPEMNGYEATLKIRAFEEEKQASKSVPIIAMTASLLQHEIVKCYEVGMNNFIPKPYKIDELIGSVYTEATKTKM